MTTGRLLVLAPLRVEARAMRAGAPGALVVRTGMGPARSSRVAAGLVSASPPVTAVAVAGVCGALTHGLAPGDLVVASEVRGPNGSIALPSAGLVAASLRRAGLRVHVGAMVTTATLARGARRQALAETGALAADMESAALVDVAWMRPITVVRAVVDTPDHELSSPATVTSGLAALRSLRQAGPVLVAWAEAASHRQVILAGPRSFCAGVDRAIDTVERALVRYGAPIYVRKQIVHNRHVVASLESRGAVFVEELDEVPDGSTVVFSAHGVAPAVRADASVRQLSVIDATCPLVAKVHHEVRRFASQGYHVVLVGHSGHDEVVGTVGEAPDLQVLEGITDVDAVNPADPDKVACITQTTLAVDEAADIIDALKQRYPALITPPSDDICYASQNRQDAVRAIAEACDLVVVVGSRNSSNSNRLVEVARRQGCRAVLVDDETELDLADLAGAATVGITAGASAPAILVSRLVDALRALGTVEVLERAVTTEHVSFSLPPEVR